MVRYLPLFLFVGVAWGQDSTNIENQFQQTEIINGKNDIN